MNSCPQNGVSRPFTELNFLWFFGTGWNLMGFEGSLMISCSFGWAIYIKLTHMNVLLETMVVLGYWLGEFGRQLNAWGVDTANCTCKGTRTLSHWSSQTAPAADAALPYVKFQAVPGRTQAIPSELKGACFLECISRRVVGWPLPKYCKEVHRTRNVPKGIHQPLELPLHQ